MFFGAFFNVVYIFAPYIKQSPYFFQTSDIIIFINGSFIFSRRTFMQRFPSFWYVCLRQNTTQQQYVVFKCYPSTCIFSYTLNDVMIYFVVLRVWHMFHLYIQTDTFLSFNLIYNTYASGTSDKLFGYISIVPLRNFNKLTNIVRNVLAFPSFNVTHQWRFFFGHYVDIVAPDKPAYKRGRI